MRLTYVTRVAVPSPAAQAGQILSMSHAFHRQLGADFRLVSAASSEPAPEVAFAWTRRTAPSRLARYPAFCAEAVRVSRASQESVVFTRDIGVAAATVLSGGRAVYEAHKDPVGVAARRLTALLVRSERFRLVCISEALTDYYVKHFGIPRERVLSAHDGVFPEQYPDRGGEERAALRDALGLPHDRVLVVHTGSLFVGRGAELFEQVCRADPRVLFVQVGGSAEDVERVRRHYEVRSVNNIEFVPRQSVDSVRRYQAVADVLFYMTTRQSPIHWCTSPLKLFEYLASGRPVLGSPVGSVAEIIDDRKAWCFDPERPGSVAEALGNLLAHPDEAENRARLARDETLREHSWYRRAERISAFAAA